MSATNSLADILKSAQTASSPSGLSTLLVNALGEIVKMGAIQIDLTIHRNLDLNEIKEPCILGIGQPCQNCPLSYENLLLVCIPTGSSVYQWLARSGGGGQFLFRPFSTVWYPWKEISMTSVAT